MLHSLFRSRRRLAHAIVAVSAGTLAGLCTAPLQAAPQSAPPSIPSATTATDLTTRIRTWLTDAAIGGGVRDQISTDGSHSRRVSPKFFWRLPAGSRPVSPAFRLGLLKRTTAVTSLSSNDVLGSVGLRPIMAGASWRLFTSSRASFSLSGLAGRSFNSVDTDDRTAREPHRPSSQPVTAMTNALALEGGARLWIDVTPITGVSLGVSMLRTRPRLTFEDGHTETWVADHVRLEAGLVVKILRLF